MTHEAGKGDKQLPTNKEAFDKHFEEIFGKKPPKDLSQAVQNQVIDAVNLQSDPSGLKLRDRIGMMPIEDAHRLFGKDGEWDKNK